MAETKAMILQMRPKVQELRDARTYTEAQVKRILFAFARDLGCKWRKDRLEKFIETAFDF
jgi:hypothetical protein